MRYLILKRLYEFAAKRLDDYCCICGKRMVRYPDGYMDCPDIVPSEKARRGLSVEAS